jgi:hypothetical protein
MTEKVYEWSGFVLDDSRRPWRLRNMMNLLMQQGQNRISLNWKSCVCNIFFEETARWPVLTFSYIKKYIREFTRLQAQIKDDSMLWELITKS